MNMWDEWGLSWWNNITPILTGPYPYLLTTTNADTKSNCQQNDSLDCGHDENGIPILKVKDDAGRKCCPNEIRKVILANRIDKHSFYGHTFIRIENDNSYGFFGRSDIESDFGYFYTVGEVKDSDSTYNINYNISRCYNACPSSCKILKEIIDSTEYASYSIINIPFAHNCTDMAYLWLEKAGFSVNGLKSFLFWGPIGASIMLVPLPWFSILRAKTLHLYENFFSLFGLDELIP